MVSTTFGCSMMGATMTVATSESSSPELGLQLHRDVGDEAEQVELPIGVGQQVSGREVLQHAEGSGLV